uniref:Uncharacterized protein n=1 Tax=Poecilia mexicana TaxID=48701 RepID=A0A3B3WZ77_9TELE
VKLFSFIIESNMYLSQDCTERHLLQYRHVLLIHTNITNLIFSATDTEGVHTLLGDLLPPDVYFRFNPMMNDEVSLDENQPEALDKLVMETQEYLETNRSKVAKLCLVLNSQRSPVDRDTVDNLPFFIENKTYQTKVSDALF